MSGDLSDEEIYLILDRLIGSSATSTANTSSINDKFMLDFVDIDKFIDVLYSLLDSNNYIISKDDTESEKSSEDKFIFTQEYPDLDIFQQQVVTVEISKRTLANLSAGSNPFSGTSRYRPVYLGQEKDPVSGGININMQNMYDNELQLTSWAPTMLAARRLATLIESIVQKYYYVLRKYVPIILYEGRGQMIQSSNFGNSRYFGIPTSFFVRTNERFIVKEDELRTITIKANIL